MRIIELKLYADDLDAQSSFYHELLGIPIIETKQGYLSLQVGRTKLVNEKSDGQGAPYYHFALNISENKIQQALRWLENKVTITEDAGEKIIDFPSWNAHSIYFNDPAGNIVELIARHNLKHGSTEEEFTIHDIHSVDEIGLSFTEVLGTIETIKSEFVLANWRPASASFAPIGDEEGLFIVVKEGRTWYMSDKPAVNFPLEVTFLGNEKKEIKFGNYLLKSVVQ